MISLSFYKNKLGRLIYSAEKEKHYILVKDICIEKGKLLSNYLLFLSKTVFLNDF